MTNNTKLLVVVGSGPGIGVATASRFASEGYNIALLSRNAERLENDAKTVQQNAKGNEVEVKTFPVDTGDHVALKQVLNDVEASLGSPSSVLFNAARVAPSQIGQVDPEFILEDFKMMNIGMYVAAAWALPLLEKVAKSTHASFLVSGGDIYDHPLHEFFSLSMQKAAQYNFCGSLSQVAGPKNIHVGWVNIAPVVSDEHPVANPKNIAEQHWKLHNQDKNAWESKIDIGSIDEVIKMIRG